MAGSLGSWWSGHGRVVLIVLAVVAGDVDDGRGGIWLRVGLYRHQLDKRPGGPTISGWAVPQVGQMESWPELGIKPIAGVGWVVLEGDEDRSDPLGVCEDSRGRGVQLDVVVGQLLGELDLGCCPFSRREVDGIWRVKTHGGEPLKHQVVRGGVGDGDPSLGEPRLVPCDVGVEDPAVGYLGLDQEHAIKRERLVLLFGGGFAEGHGQVVRPVQGLDARGGSLLWWGFKIWVD